MRIIKIVLVILCLFLILVNPIEAAYLNKIWTKTINEDEEIYGFATWGDGYLGYTTTNSVKIFDRDGKSILDKKLSSTYHYIDIGDNCFFLQRGGDGEICEMRMFDFSGKELWSIDGYGFSGATFSPNSNYIVSADYADDIEFRIINKQGETLLQRNRGSVYVKFSTNEQFLSVTGHGIFRLEGNMVETLVLDEELGYERRETYFVGNNTKILIRERKPGNQLRLYNVQLDLLWSREIKPSAKVNVFQDQIYCSAKDVLEIYNLEGDLIQILRFDGKKISEELWGGQSGDYCIVYTYIFPEKEWFNILNKNGNLVNIQEYPYNTNRIYEYNEKGCLLYSFTSTGEKTYILECYEIE